MAVAPRLPSERPDLSGLPTTTTIQNPGGGVSLVTKAYDSLGRVTSYTDADGNVSTTTYDIDGRPSTV